MPDGLPAPLEIQIPTNLEFVRPVRKMLEGLLYAQGWEEDDVDDASLIVTEIVQNAVEHGSRGDGKEWVRIALSVEPGGLGMEVEDPGSGEDPQIALDRDLEKPVPMDEPRGRGLFLINRLAQEFERSIGASGGLNLKARKEIAS
ncbi:MAG: ATP-binding protein [Planctomycetota bacterium]|nr:ATP-binding protein [Planctomycetota bacterium]